MAVGLHQHNGDPARDRGQPDRPGDVASRAEHDVGAALAEDPETRRRGGERLRHRPPERKTGPPREARDREGVKRVAALGDERRLDAVRRAGERHEHAAALERFRDCECRRDVPDRPPGCDQAPQLLLVRHYERC